jgi:hypothetical protein
MTALIATALTAGLLATSSVPGPSPIPLAPDISMAPYAQTATGADPETSSKWGVNDGGWNVTIVNDTPTTLSTAYTELSNVAKADPQILPWSTNRSVLGKPSIFGGPANMDIILNRAANSNVIWLLIRSDFISNVPAVSCRMYSPEYTCM